MLDNLFDDDIGVSEGEESDFEGEGIYSYLAGASNKNLDPLQFQDDPEEEDQFSTLSSEGEDNLDLATGKYSIVISLELVYKVYKPRLL